MRETGGLDFIHRALQCMEKTHLEDIKNYGFENDKRLSGKHETSSMEIFTHGVGHRGCSV